MPGTEEPAGAEHAPVASGAVVAQGAAHSSASPSSLGASAQPAATPPTNATSTTHDRNAGSVAQFPTCTVASSMRGADAAPSPAAPQDEVGAAAGVIGEAGAAVAEAGARAGSPGAGASPDRVPSPAQALDLLAQPAVSPAASPPVLPSTVALGEPTGAATALQTTAEAVPATKSEAEVASVGGVLLEQAGVAKTGVAENVLPPVALVASVALAAVEVAPPPVASDTTASEQPLSRPMNAQPHASTRCSSSDSAAVRPSPLAASAKASSPAFLAAMSSVGTLVGVAIGAAVGKSVSELIEAPVDKSAGVSELRFPLPPQPELGVTAPEQAPLATDEPETLKQSPTSRADPMQKPALLQNKTGSELTGPPLALPTTGKGAIELKEGDIVWAKLKGFPWWPSVVFPTWDAVKRWELKTSMSSLPKVAEGDCIVYFLETLNFNVLPNTEAHILRFPEHLTEKRHQKLKSSGQKKKFTSAVDEAISLLNGNTEDTTAEPTGRAHASDSKQKKRKRKGQDSKASKAKSSSSAAPPASKGIPVPQDDAESKAQKLVTLVSLLDSGLLQAGTNMLSMEHKGQRHYADLSRDGMLMMHTETFTTISHFIAYVQQTRTSGRRIHDGWDKVFFGDKLLSVFLEVKKKEEEPAKPQELSTPAQSRKQAAERPPVHQLEANASHEECKTERKRKSGKIVHPTPVSSEKQPKSRKKTKHDSDVVVVDSVPPKSSSKKSKKAPPASPQVHDVDMDVEEATPLSKHWLAPSSPDNLLTVSKTNKGACKVWADEYFTDASDSEKDDVEDESSSRTCYSASRLRNDRQRRASSVKHSQLKSGLAENSLDPHTMVQCENYSHLKDAATNSSRGALLGTQPFSVRMHPEVSFLCDLHSHLAEVEIIGFLGGKWDPVKRCVYIQAAFPCRSLKTDDHDGSTDVEMDPTSELQIRDVIRSQDLQVVGWYHSHPSFQPDPSVTDIENQSNYQGLFEDAATGVQPFVGLIVGTYDVRMAGRRSIFRYFHIQREKMVGFPAGVPLPFLLEVRVRKYRKHLQQGNVCKDANNICMYPAVYDALGFKTQNQGRAIGVDIDSVVITTVLQADAGQMGAILPLAQDQNDLASGISGAIHTMADAGVIAGPSFAIQPLATESCDQPSDHVLGQAIVGIAASAAKVSNPASVAVAGPILVESGRLMASSQMDSPSQPNNLILIENTDFGKPPDVAPIAVSLGTQQPAIPVSVNESTREHENSAIVAVVDVASSQASNIPTENHTSVYDMANAICRNLQEATHSQEAALIEKAAAELNAIIRLCVNGDFLLEMHSKLGKIAQLQKRGLWNQAVTWSFAALKNFEEGAQFVKAQVQAERQANAKAPEEKDPKLTTDQYILYSPQGGHHML